MGSAYNFTGGTLTVRLSDLSAGGVLVADAVRIERIGDATATDPQAQVVDGATAVPSGAGAVDFGGTGVGSPEDPHVHGEQRGRDPT